MVDSADDIYAHVVIDENNTTATINLERKNTGYKAVYQSAISYVGETQRNEMKEEFLNYIDNDTKPENVVFENDSSVFYGEKPFIGKCTLKSSNFIEHAGDKLLFKIGMLIGPQTNLYNSNERKLNVEIEYLKEYNRVITFEIPEGYSVKNLNDLNLSVQPEFKEGAIGFVSTYELKENQLIVKVREWYNSIIIPVSEYKSYENVINAAADFNKLVIVLEKK
jgi:methionine synthase II (cobalamin-independent)